MVWGEEQAKHSLLRQSGTRTLEEAMSEFKTLKFNEYVSPLGHLRDRDAPSMEDLCMCTEQCNYQCLNRSLQIECHSDNCPIVKKSQPCGNQRMGKFERRKIEPRLMPGKGVGMFAGEYIPSNQLVNEYVGEVITEAECLRRLANEYADEKVGVYMLVFLNSSWVRDLPNPCPLDSFLVVVNLRSFNTRFACVLNTNGIYRTLFFC
jgi:hypothetical protein